MIVNDLDRSLHRFHRGQAGESSPQPQDHRQREDQRFQASPERQVEVGRPAGKSCGFAPLARPGVGRGSPSLGEPFDHISACRTRLHSSRPGPLGSTVLPWRGPASSSVLPSPDGRD
jgi:hypothetical protein